MDFAIKIIIFSIATPALFTLKGGLIVLLWNWFVIPTFNVPTLSIP